MIVSEEALLSRIKSLPLISSTTLEITRLISNQSYRTGDLVKLIETDLTLASKCLQMVNSPLFGLKAKVGTIQRAVVLLGSNTVANIALQTGMSKCFKEDLVGYNSTKEDLWQHGLRTAIASRLITEQLFGLESSGLAYAAGLLHDIGKIVISDFLEQNYAEFSAPTIMRDHKDFLDAESQKLGCNHAKVGEMVAQKWNLPEPIGVAIQHHHHPSEAPDEYRELTLAVHLGDVFAMLEGYTTQLDGLSYTIDPIAEEYVKKDPAWEIKTYPKLLLEIDSEFVKAIKLSTASTGGGGDHV